MPVRLLLIVPHFPPDTAPTGVVAGRWVEALAAAGHRIEVVTSLPWYREHRIEPGWGGRLVRTETTEWGRIRRLHPFPAPDKTDLVRRALAFGGFTLLAAGAGLAAPRVDAVISMSPPLTLGAAGWVSARRHRAVGVFNVQDVYPDVLIEVGAISPTGRMARLLGAVERWTYRRAEAVTVLSDDLRRSLINRVDDPNRVRVIPNFADTAGIVPGERENSYRRQFGLEGTRVLMYAGNVGWSQPLNLLVHAARELGPAHPDLRVVINGSGSALARWKEQAAGLENLVFVPPQPEERLNEVLAAADIHAVPLASGLSRSSVPSKLYSIMAAGRPVLASVDPGSEVARIVEAAGAGLTVAPDDPDAFTAALRAQLVAPDLTAQGEAARRFVLSWPGPDEVVGSYVDLIEELGRR